MNYAVSLSQPLFGHNSQRPRRIPGDVVRLARLRTQPPATLCLYDLMDKTAGVLGLETRPNRDTTVRDLTPAQREFCESVVFRTTARSNKGATGFELTGYQFLELIRNGLRVFNNEPRRLSKQLTGNIHAAASDWDFTVNTDHPRHSGGYNPNLIGVLTEAQKLGLVETTSKGDTTIYRLNEQGWRAMDELDRLVTDTRRRRLVALA